MLPYLYFSYIYAWDTEITDHCGALTVAIKRIEPLETKVSRNKAYKLTVSASDRDKLFDSGFWSQGIFVRKKICGPTPFFHTLTFY